MTSLQKEIDKAKEIKLEQDPHLFKRRFIASLEKIKGLDKGNQKEVFSFCNNYCKKEDLGIGRKEKVLTERRVWIKRVTEFHFIEKVNGLEQWLPYEKFLFSGVDGGFLRRVRL